MLSSLISPAWPWAKTSSRVTLRAWRRASASVLRRLPRSLGELAGAAVVLDDLNVLAGLADAVEAEHLDRIAGPGRLDAGAGVVVHRPDLAPLRAGDDRVADLQRAALDEDGDDRAAAGVELGLDHGAGGVGVGVRLQLLELGDEDDHVEQVVEALLGLRRDVDVDGVAAPVLGVQPVRRRARCGRGRAGRPPCRSC